MYTVGRTIYPGMKVPLWFNPSETFEGNSGEPCYRIVIIEEGTGILHVEDRPVYFIAPALLCLNERESVTVESAAGYRTESLWFHPSFVNSVFSFENLREGSPAFSETEFRDRHWFRPFFHRDTQYFGTIKTGPLTASRIAGLLRKVGSELTDQPDGYWPCRSRSYLLELLFLIDRVYREPDSFNPISTIPVIQDDISEIIVFLNSRYPEKVTIATLTKTFHINRTTMAERFLKVTGMPVMTYLIHLRTHLAALMLRDSMVPAAEIAERVGFGDYAHFTRMFNKYFGCSPNEYQQQNCWLIAR